MRKPSVSPLSSIVAFPADEWFTYDDVAHLGWKRATFSARCSLLVRRGVLIRLLDGKKRVSFFITSKLKEAEINRLTGLEDKSIAEKLFDKVMRA